MNRIDRTATNDVHPPSEWHGGHSHPFFLPPTRSAHNFVLFTMAKKKRSASLQEDSEDERVDDRSSEDEVMSEDEKDETAPEDAANDGEIPFLDTFYGLASPSPSERAQSAHALLQHCLLGPSANSKDAAYAFRRLLNGLCSGRAAARQGYASAFASFLKIAHATGALKEVQSETTKDDEDEREESLLEFVRKQLLKTTDPTQAQGGKFGKVKGSEERDYQFGRLFGILGVVRSGILLPSEESDLTQVKNVSLGLVEDLIELFHHKKWMREPTSHGIITLMNSLYESGNSDDCKVVLNHLVKQAIVPKLFAGKGVDSMNAEQIAVALSIQMHDGFFDSELPSPLNQAIISSATIPTLVDALSATSSVVHPRIHVVWDVLWLFLTEETKENGRVRTLCQSCPISEENGSKIVKALIQNLVIQSLLAIGTDGDGSNPTHERRALALSIVRAACGGQLSSSAAGEFVISTNLELLENVVLSSDIVKRLFLDVICAGGNAKGAHMLKPLALHVLDTIVESEVLIDLSSAETLDRRLSIAKTLLSTDPRFDGRTRTSTVTNLLLLDDTVELAYSQGIGQMWTTYIAFLENQILRTSLHGDGDVVMEGDGDASKLGPHEALGYIDLLFNVAKRILRLVVDAEEEAEFEKLKSAIVQRIMGFFMASAFFDCSTLSEPKKPKKKKGRKQSFDAAEIHPVVLEGIRIKDRTASNEGSSTLSYDIRVVLSSRFFSLLADCTSVVTARPVTVSSANKQSKDEKVLEILSDLFNGWAMLEKCGARRLAAVEETEEEANGAESIAAARNTVHEMQQKASTLLKKSVSSMDDEAGAKTRSSSGCAILASTLCLQFLRCGTSDEIIDEIEEDDGEDDDEVVEMINDLKELPNRLIEVKAEETSEDEDGEPLLGLTELCIQVLSSQVGSGGQSRGALPKLLREAVKFAWIGGLSAYAAADGKATLEDEVLESLVGAIGASSAEETDNGAEDESDSDEENSDSDESDEDKPVFSQAAGEALGLDDDASDVEMNGEGDSDSEDEDVELDPEQLESMLREEGDAILDEDGIEVGELEHHAGADAALAQLIKLKQDARKAGRRALERLEISKQLRCALLLDTMLSNPGRHWSNLLQPTVFMKLVLPLLQARRDLEKSLERVSTNQLGKKATGLDNEKRALLERLTSLLKMKLCKVRWLRDMQPDSTDVVQLSTELMNQARKSSSSEHASCSSTALLALFKSLSNVDDMVNAAGVYGEAMTEWSTKRSTNLPTILFDDLIQQSPRYVACCSCFLASVESIGSSDTLVP